jgi:LCP family protein required for cell wall assembly
MTHRNSNSSLDGFVPSNQGRHIGFNFDSSNRQSSQNQRIRTRRPALHNSGSPMATRPGSGGRPTAATQRTNARQTFPGFTSYGASRSTTVGGNRQPLGQVPVPAPDGGRRRGRHGKASSQTKDAKKRNIFRRVSWKKVIKRTTLVAGVFILAAGGWLGYKAFMNGSKVFGDNNILGLLNATKLKGEDKGRVNILLAGVSSDDPGHQGGDLTDSIMILSVDTVNKQAYMLSIPRDLWVDIPGYGHAKINAANVYGDQDKYSQDGYPPGGMGLLAQVISENFQLSINYYAKINYSALRDMVNAVGGIQVNVQSSDSRGLYDPNISIADHGPLKLPNGVQTLDGQTALNLARARGDPTGDGRVAYGFEKSDFDRTEHQRMMMLALKDKITSGSVITNPLKIGQLFDALGKNVSTDFQPSEVRRLYDLGKQINTNEIKSLSLNDANGSNLLASYRSPDGASALIPAAGLDDFSSIVLYLKKAMTNDPIAREAAKIVILNGGDHIGLASKFSNQLTAKGLNVTAVGDAPHQEGGSTIIDLSNNGKSATKSYLTQTFGTNVTTTNSTTYTDADFIVILGTNQTAPTSTSSSDSE